MKDILKHVLKNALDFGKVNQKVVLGLVLRDNSELKKDVPKVLKEIDKVIKDVEKLSKEDIQKQLQKIAPSLLKEKKEEKKGPLKELKNAQEGKVVVRIAPSPSGPLHIGHAYGASLNYEYAKMYKGKFLVRIEDTNPENLYEPAYLMIPDDANWLTEDNVAKVIIQSDRLGIYYDYAEKIVDMEKAYVCTCDSDKWREMKNNGKACPCRSINKKENQTRYAKMFTEYAEGEAVLRLKTDIADKNPAMRDFPILRINEHIHPRTKKSQRVWPLMVFSVAVDDHDLGITHVLNGKEHADNSKKEQIIMDCFGWKHPEYQHWGRINFIGLKVSKSKTKLAIEQNEYTGWDDIRLPFLPALRKRGYQPEAFRKYALEVGLSLNDKTVPIEEFWKNVNAFNKDIVEPKSNRFFFVEKPVLVNIEGMSDKIVEMDLHPDFSKRGKRKLKVTSKFFISEHDIHRLKPGKIHRLIDCCNFEVKGDKYHYVSEDYQEFKDSEKKGMIIHWLPSKDNFKVSIMNEDGHYIEGLGEETMESIREGDIVQFERFAFCRLDKIEKNKKVFWYLHK
jgi:glutamyl-tRNA synthetase